MKHPKISPECAMSSMLALRDYWAETVLQRKAIADKVGLTHEQFALHEAKFMELSHDPTWINLIKKKRR